MDRCRTVFIFYLSSLMERKKKLADLWSEHRFFWGSIFIHSHTSHWAALCQNNKFYSLICPHKYVTDVPIIIQKFSTFWYFHSWISPITAHINEDSKPTKRKKKRHFLCIIALRQRLLSFNSHVIACWHSVFTDVINFAMTEKKPLQWRSQWSGLRIELRREKYKNDIFNEFMKKSNK